MKRSLALAGWIAAATVACVAASPAAAVQVQNSSGVLTSTLRLTSAASDALAGAGISMTPFIPGAPTTTVVNLPVTTVELTGQTSPFQFNSVSTDLGLVLKSTPNFSNTGGMLTLSGLRVDVGSGTVYGAVQGDNGLGTRDAVPLFTLSAVQTNAVSYGVFVLDVPIDTGPEVFSASLQWTAAGRQVLKQGLGLNSTGDVVLDQAPVFATFTVTAPVPEPASWALSALGLVAAAAVSRRRRPASRVPA